MRFLYFILLLTGLCSCSYDNEVSTCDPKFPTAFSPNGDNVNDTYGLLNPSDIEEFILLIILDRKGNVIFTSSDPQVKWDGMDNGVIHNNETYIAILEYKCNGMSNKLRQGFTIFI